MKEVQLYQRAGRLLMELTVFVHGAPHLTAVANISIM